MTDPTPQFETDEVSATRAREQGLGVGARELAAQRDPGETPSRDDDDASSETDEIIDQNTAVLGQDDELDDERS